MTGTTSKISRRQTLVAGTAAVATVAALPSLVNPSGTDPRLLSDNPIEDNPDADILKLHDRLIEHRAAWDRQSPQSDREFNRWAQIDWDLEQAVLAVPAQSARGVLIKYQLLAHMMHRPGSATPYECLLWDGVRTDLTRLAGVQS